MSGWTSAINPLSNPATEADARRQARASAVAIGLGVLMSVWGIIYVTTIGREEIQAAMDQALAASPEAAGMTGMMGSFVIGVDVVTLVIQAILGLVQWFKPNIVIPIIFTVLVVYGLGSSALGLMMQDQAAAAVQPAAWQTVLNFVVLAVQLILHIAGIRGASALSKFRES